MALDRFCWMRHSYFDVTPTHYIQIRNWRL
jgi:hypothetical protein